MEQDPWKYYFERFSERAERVPDRAFGRSELLYEAAHDAYQNTTDHLTRSGWGEEAALTVTKMFGQVVKEWLARDDADLQDLRTHLQSSYTNWSK
jgi:hypothetical protein